MPEPVSLAQLKAQLRLGADPSDEDERLVGLGTAARRLVEHRINRVLIDAGVTLAADDLAVARQAILLIVTAWYDGSAEDGELPRAATCLLAPLRRWSNPPAIVA